METQEISEDWIRIVQEYIIEYQLKGTGEESDEKRNENSDGLKKIIQQEFIKENISTDNIKGMLEDNDKAFELHRAITDRSSKENADNIFHEAIDELKKFIEVTYGLSPRRKKAHEILAEELDKKFGEGHISNNVNHLLEKNVGHGGHVCDDGGCGC